MYSIRASAFVTIIAMWFFMQLSFGTHLAQCVHKESGQTDNFIHETRKQGQDAYQRIQILFWESKTLLGVKHLTLPWISYQLNISLRSKIYFWKSFKTEIKQQCWSPLFCWNTCWMDTWTKACHLAWWAWEGWQCNTCDGGVSGGNYKWPLCTNHPSSIPRTD